MATNPTIKLTSKSGTVKKIPASAITGDMRADAAWYSGSASVVTTLPYTFSNANKEWMILEKGEYAKIEFSPDSNGSDGQGFVAQATGSTWEIDSVTGTVYLLRGKFIDMADTKADIFANQNRQSASVGDKLYTGDAVLCSKTASKFALKITALLEDYANYVAFGIVQQGIYE